jgi:hypothetical protein
VKNQTSRCIKGYLLRGAIYLLLLVGICLIPLAFPQRAIIQRAAHHPAPSPTPAVPNGGCGLAWRVVTSPNGSANTNILFGVGRNYFSYTYAVGTYYDENFTSQTLIEQWDGSAWTVQASLNPGTTGNQLNAVAVDSSVRPWAVGFFTDDNFVAHTLVEHLPFPSWIVVPSPDNGSNGSYLQSVAALDTNDVWAVGYYIDDNLVNQTLVEHWNGQSWTIIPSPNRGADGSQLTGVAAVSPNDIWAVGNSGQGNAVQTLIEHWNGSSWSIVDSPNPGASGNYLQAAATISATDVWAVGYYYESSHPRTLIERWDGASWNVVPSPNVGTTGNSLFAISGVDSNDVSAVGAYNLNNQTGALQTLIEHWDGATWNIVASPNQGTTDNILYGITYGPADPYRFRVPWSVGTYSDGINGQTLTLEYRDPCAPTPTPTATGGEPSCRVAPPTPCDDVSFPRTDFFVFVSCPVESCSPGGFTVNGVPADSCTVTGGVSFHFNTSPVVPGFNTLHIQSGAIFCSSFCFFNSVPEFTCTFQYVPPPPTPTPTPSPTPTATPTPTPSPRPTPGSRPRPTPHPRP